MDRQKLLQSNLDRIVKTLVGQYGVSKIIVFGSLANQTVNENSDIDLIVIKKTVVPFYKRLKEVALLCNYHVGVDILVYTPEEYADLCQYNPFFSREIVEKGRTLYDEAA